MLHCVGICLVLWYMNFSYIFEYILHFTLQNSVWTRKLGSRSKVWFCWCTGYSPVYAALWDTVESCRHYLPCCAVLCSPFQIGIKLWHLADCGTLYRTTQIWQDHLLFADARAVWTMFIILFQLKSGAWVPKCAWLCYWQEPVMWDNVWPEKLSYLMPQQLGVSATMTSHHSSGGDFLQDWWKLHWCFHKYWGWEACSLAQIYNWHQSSLPLK